jgi:hypothetical protein
MNCLSEANYVLSCSERLMLKPWLGAEEGGLRLSVNSDCVLTPQHLWCAGLFSLTLQCRYDCNLVDRDRCQS